MRSIVWLALLLPLAPAFAGPVVHVFHVAARGTFETVAADGTATTVGIGGSDFLLAAGSPRWALAAGDTVLGASFGDSRETLLVRGTAGLARLARNGTRRTLWAAPEDERLRLAVAASEDEKGRLFVLDDKDRLTMVVDGMPQDLATFPDLKGVGPLRLRQSGRYVVEFEVRFKESERLRWVDDWHRRQPTPGDFAEAHSSSGYSPWEAVGMRTVAPISMTIRDLFLQDGDPDKAFSQTYVFQNVFPRAPGDQPHWDCPAAESTGATVRVGMQLSAPALKRVGLFPDCPAVLQ